MFDYLKYRVYKMNNPMMTDIQQAFLDRYLATLDNAERAAIPQINAEHFCADEWNANTCAAFRAGAHFDELLTKE